MFDLEKAKAKTKRYFIISCALDILTIILAVLGLMHKIPAGFSFVSLAITLVFSALYYKSRKDIKESEKK